MHNRLKNWMESRGLKSSELAHFIGVNRATISHILSGRNKPSIDFLQKLLSVYPKLNSNWLITGIGYMNTDDSDNTAQSFKSIERVVVFYKDKSFQEVKE
ncbi:MAG: helix-turn-helix transcriptional regulator [Flavobacteriales bacterium]|nr:helix-turn-helix transcriptional regulator [Flavobacteriales bacterium]MDG1933546.1 helix-turn-helix transcriptional regulator [Flavobacteriales bacterium]MDG2086006.1 helix-turn-helix transcriptional regulator [Flavobacteriales bacterium]